MLDVVVQLVIVVEQSKVLAFSFVELLHHDGNIVCSRDLLDLFPVMLALGQHELLITAFLKSSLTRKNRIDY